MAQKRLEGGAREPGGRNQMITQFFNNGEFFRAYDLAIAALEHDPADTWLAHRAVLSLANSGATELALEKFTELGLELSDQLDVRALLGRLKKDQAFAETGERRHRLIAE